MNLMLFKTDFRDIKQGDVIAIKRVPSSGGVEMIAGTVYFNNLSFEVITFNKPHEKHKQVSYSSFAYELFDLSYAFITLDSHPEYFL